MYAEGIVWGTADAVVAFHTRPWVYNLLAISTDDTELTIRAHIREQRRNIVVIDATLTDSAGNICTEATCTYFSFPREKAERDMHFVSCKVEDEE